MPIQKASNDDYAIRINETDDEVEVYNTTKNKGIKFDKSFYDHSPFLNQLLNQFPKVDEKPEGIKSVGKKQKFSTIHRGLVEIRLLKSGIYERYQSIVKRLGNEQAINFMINELIKDRRHPMHLVASINHLTERMEDRLDPNRSNVNYWKEKYETLKKLARTGDWYLDYVYDYGDNARGTCELGHDIRYGLVVRDKNSNERLIFGIDCIVDFFEISDDDKKIFHSLITRYQSVLYNYVYTVESMLYPIGDNRAVNWGAVLSNQSDALKALRPYVTFNQQYARHVESTLKDRRAYDFQDNLVTQQEYDGIIRLLDAHVPLPIELIALLVDQEYSVGDIESDYSFDKKLSDRIAKIPQHAFMLGMLGQHLPIAKRGTKYYSLVGYPLEKAAFMDKLNDDKRFGKTTPQHVRDFDLRNHDAIITQPNSIKQIVQKIQTIGQLPISGKDYLEKAFEHVNSNYGFFPFANSWASRAEDRVYNYPQTVDVVYEWQQMSWLDEVKNAKKEEEERKREEEEKRKQKEEEEKLKANPNRLEILVDDFIAQDQNRGLLKSKYKQDNENNWSAVSCLAIFEGQVPIAPHIIVKLDESGLREKYPKNADTIELALLKQYVDDGTVSWETIKNDQYFAKYGGKLEFALNQIGDTLHNNLEKHGHGADPLTDNQLRFFRPYGHYLLEHYALGNDAPAID